ncbi:M4 family metallopeptidase [Sabulilitoribacter multivorans]|uniref:M4 family metallopeptidase n=1 Tax=Flaviramulus multivorans TaxID=1304750 RepID=A0ABS9IKR4_9FLAO|nr:M4 family metallopeptidase [Flaviramulus multivorans]MCF7561162.1 M4 family metallopeptidase [Flaviramulus multivorans]
MKKITLLFLAFFHFSFLAISQESKTQKAINDLKKTTQANISINKNLNIPSFIKFPISKPLQLSGKTLKEKVNNFLANNKSIYAIQTIDESLFSGIIKTDNYGLKNYTLKQHYKGVPVYDSELRFHFNRNEHLTSINGNFIPEIELNPIPNIDKNGANSIALNIVAKQNINHSGEPLKVITTELYIFPKGLAQGYVTSKHLAYRIEIRNDADVREYLFIDAHTGKLIEQFTGIAHALNRILYEENTSTVVWTEGDALPGTLDIWQQNEIVAAGHTYNFFNNAFGFDSYDGAGAQMRTINNNPNISCPNANWNGVTANYCTGTASDDVVAHEWGHAYTEYTCNLIYEYESGAINESLSDIWGETIDILNLYEDAGENLSLRTGCSSSDRWRIGEDASAFGGAIRDMWDPNCANDPGSVTDIEYQCDYTFNDNGGVHSNSGIPNHLYALLVDGGNYNGQTISSLGFLKAAHIFWRAQSQYLTATSDFNALADALEASCADLVDANLNNLSVSDTPTGVSRQKITVADCAEVSKAILAVALRSDNNCTYAKILADTPNLCEAATSNPIFTEDWESGLASWTISQEPVNPSTWESRDWEIASDLPNERSGQAVFAVNPINGDCNLDLQNGIMRLESPTITMPNYASGNFEMAFFHNVSTEQDYDGGNIKYSIDGGAWAIIPASAFITNAYNLTLNNSNNDNPMMGEDAFSGADQGTSNSDWGQSVIDLTSIGVVANSNLKLRWELGSDGCNGKIGWYVDDIVIYNCSEALSVNDINFLSKNVKIYPNPSTGIFNVQLKSLSNFSFELFDITGKSIMNSVNVTENSFEIDLSQHSQGVYFFKLKSNEGTLTKKLLVQ